MYRGLLVSIIAVAIFALTTFVAADNRLFSTVEETSRHTAKSLAASRSAMLVNARTYRSPGRLRKVVIDATDREAIASALADGATEIGDYGSFKLFVMDNDALDRDTSRQGRGNAEMEFDSLG